MRPVVLGRALRARSRRRAASRRNARRTRLAGSATRPRDSRSPYANEWLSSYQGRTSRGIRVETLADYRHELGLYALPLLGGLRLGEIEPRHVKELAALVSDGGRRKPRTVKLAIAPLRALLATAVEDGLIRSNPAAGVRIAQPDTLEEDLNHAVQERALTPEQLARLIAEIPESHRPFVTFVAQTGLRIGEAIAVQWRDVDLDSGLLHIRRRYYRSAYAPPKTRYGRRVLPVTPAMAALLRSRRDLLEPGPAELVWPSRTGRPLNPDSTRARVLKPAASRAAVPWVSWHILRHTCGTLLFREGWSIKAVQHYLGHHSAAFTLAVYVHFLPGDMPATRSSTASSAREAYRRQRNGRTRMCVRALVTPSVTPSLLPPTEPKRMRNKSRRLAGRTRQWAGQGSNLRPWD
jgi:integrase